MICRIEGLVLDSGERVIVVTSILRQLTRPLCKLA
jgi:hypothetical protein